MLRDELPALSHLCGYFHQDAFLDHPDADAVLQFYTEMESHTLIRQAARDLDKLLSLNLTEEELRNALFFDLVCEYDATVDGWPSFREWLQHVRVRLVSALGCQDA